MESNALLYWLGSVPGIGIDKMRNILNSFPDTRFIEKAGREELSRVEGLRDKDVENILSRKYRERAETEFHHLKDRGIACYPYGSSEYPDFLKKIYQPPQMLYVKGRLPDCTKLSISIVGARNCTCYGRDMARLFGYRLARAGVQIVSGMALGIDGWGHQGALEGGGDTFAVLGSGVEVCYPVRHRRLYESICRNGGVLSEFPPNMPAKPQFFPLRNRLISAFSQGILVVEAREKSGSLITADAALEQGKDVFVVPGRIGDVLSCGCNRLIRQGAIPVLAPSDILEYYGWEAEAPKEKSSAMEEKILARLGEKPVHIDQIQSETGESRVSVFKVIFKLREEGRVREVSRDYYIRI